jgi:hypothetical protein
MPVAAVHEDDGAPTGKDEVGLARQALPMKPETVAEAVRETPDEHLGRRVLGADGGHRAAADWINGH